MLNKTPLQEEISALKELVELLKESNESLREHRAQDRKRALCAEDQAERLHEALRQTSAERDMLRRSYDRAMNKIELQKINLDLVEKLTSPRVIQLGRPSA